MKIIKKVVEIGNGAAVYVSKEYVGKEVTIIFPENTQELKKRILNSLIEFMPNIIGVYLFGSYARGEQTEDSDIDVLIIVQEKDERIKAVLQGMDIRIITLETIKRSIANFPVLIIPILRESIPLFNKNLLDDLNSIKINFSKFNWSFSEIKRIIKIIEGYSELRQNEMSGDFIYSLIMRVRVCYLIECLIHNKKFTNKAIEVLLSNNGFDIEEINNFFNIYKKIRNDQESFKVVKKESVLKLLKFLKKYLEKVEDEAKKKTGKRY